MKLPKFLLQAIAVAITASTLASCEKTEYLTPTDDIVRVVKGQVVSETPPPGPDPSDYEDCPACGMG